MIKIEVSENYIKAMRKTNGPLLEENYKLYDLLEKITTIQNLDYERLKKAYYSLFGSFEIINKRLRDEWRVSTKLNNAIATNISAQYSLDKLLETNEEGDESILIRDIIRQRGVFQTTQFEKYSLDYAEPTTNLESQIIKVLSSELSSNPNLNLIITTLNFLDWLVKTSIKEYSKLLKQNNILISVRLNGKTRNYKLRRNLDFKTGLEEKIGGVDSVEKSSNTRLSWDHFGGYEDIVMEFKRISKLILNYEHARKHVPIENLIPKGILLYGPPGTGKSYLARIFCEVSGLPFKKISASDIGSTYTMGLLLNFQKTVEDLFLEMKSKNKKFGVLYIDEIDAIAPKRGLTNSVERDSFITVLNSNMDGPKAQLYPGIIYMASTNRIDIIDPALLRPGRFKSYYIGPPDKETILKIFDAQIKRRISSVEESCYNNNFKEEYSRFVSEFYTKGWTGAFVNELLNTMERNLLLRHIDEKKPFVASYNDLVIAYKSLTQSEHSPRRKTKMMVPYGDH